MIRIGLLILILLLSGCIDSVNNPLKFTEDSHDIDIVSQDGESLIKFRVYYYTPLDVPHSIEKEQEIVESLIKARDFFGKEMERHGHGYRTFDLELYSGDVVIHRKYLDFNQGEYSKDIHGELYNVINEDWAYPCNIYFVDTRYEHCGLAIPHEWGAYLFTCWGWKSVAHEVGHVLGLIHDFRDGITSDNIMSHGYKDNPFLDEGASKFISHHSAHGFENREKTGTWAGGWRRLLNDNPVKIELKFFTKKYNSFVFCIIYKGSYGDGDVIGYKDVVFEKMFKEGYNDVTVYTIKPGDIQLFIDNSPDNTVRDSVNAILIDNEGLILPSDRINFFGIYD